MMAVELGWVPITVLVGRGRELGSIVMETIPVTSLLKIGNAGQEGMALAQGFVTMTVLGVGVVNPVVTGGATSTGKGTDEKQSSR